MMNRKPMSAIILHRTDHAKNMCRYYRLDVQPDLFGQWCFIREWRRIGHPGQVRMVPYATATEAHKALAMQRRVKECRGYHAVGQSCSVFRILCESV
jgi:predicted DNA-binding WGR domain protein